MIVINPAYQIVSGRTTGIVIATEPLVAGIYDADVYMGVPGAVMNASLLVRIQGGATLATFTATATEPARMASQRFTVPSDSVIEFVASVSSPSLGSGVFQSIRVASAPLQLWTNGIKVRLADNVLIGAPTIALASGSGAAIGLSPTGGTYFLGTIQNSSGSIFEVVRCTGRSGDTLTVTRAQEGSTARAWTTAGTFFVIGETAATLGSLAAKV